MRILILALSFLSLSSVFAQNNKSGNYKTEINFGSGFDLTTFLKVKQKDNKIILTSPRNSDVRLVGFFKAKMGRLLGKSPRKGILVKINTILKKDSLSGYIVTSLFNNKLQLKGELKNGLLTGMIYKGKKIVGNIQGEKSEQKKINYSHLSPIIIKLTEQNLFSKEFLKSDKWTKYKNELKNKLNKIHDDIELYIAFKMLSSKLPFSHYYLIMQEELNEDKNKKTAQIKEKTVVYEKKNENTGYLKIKNFSSSQKELSIILPKILKAKPSNLIIDLRDNPGGGIEAAFEFGKYFMKNTTEIGFFVTNKLQYSEFDYKLFKILPKVTPQSTEEFIAYLKQEKGARLVFDKPNFPTFSGHLYVLINGNTGSTCEPIVYVLKKSKTATIVGEKTAGAMLSGTFFDVSGKYKLFLPIADFYTYDGIRLEGVGVTSDIITKSDDALSKTLTLIKENK